jgi:serine/threonine protein kinase
MAPELIRDFELNDKVPNLTKADIYSLGISIYEILCPFTCME